MQALFPQQGWLEYCPGLAPAVLKSTLSTLAAWAEGSAPRDVSLSYALAGSGKPAPMRDLMQVQYACLAVVHSIRARHGPNWFKGRPQGASSVLRAMS